VGGAIADVITFGIPKAIGESIKSGSDFSNLKFSNEGNKKFQILLTDEKEELTQLNETHNSLINLIKNKSGSEISPVIVDIFKLKEK